MKVSIILLCWNNLYIIKDSIPIIISEIDDLNKNNIETKFIVIDNNSKDGTQEWLKTQKIDKLILRPDNGGISIGKNAGLDNVDGKYFFNFDGDVIPVKGSFITMFNWMEQHEDVGCLGQFINNNTRDIKEADKEYHEIKDVKYNVKSGSGAPRAWNHYAIWRTELLVRGLRYETGGPFTAGYGYDDDDLGMQITKLYGYKIATFYNLRCYHDLESSIKFLKEENKPLKDNDRRIYFESKWGSQRENK